MPLEPFPGQNDSVLETLRKQRQSHVDAIGQIDEDLERLSGLSGHGSAWLTFPDLLECHGSITQGYPTGLSSLDSKLDGGLPRGSVTVIQGRPGIGKTLLATQIAIGLGSRCGVGALLADEGLPGARLRIGQQLGYDRRLLKKGDPDVLAGARSEFSRLCPHWYFLDPTCPEATVEQFAERLDALLPAELPRVWLLDSAQVLRSARRTARMDARQSVMAVVQVIRELTLKHRAITLLVSQVNRGSYRAKREEEQIDPLAAGSETSQIEYMAELILHLDGKPRDQVKLKCVKNRISGEGEFQLSLRLDFDRSKYFEVDELEAENEARQEREQTASKIQEAVLLELKKNPKGLTKRQLREVVRGRPSAINEAVDALYAAKKIYNEPRTGKGGGVVWKAF